jgi:RNA polymerase sigma-70 factor (ECF subfamily)
VNDDAERSDAELVEAWRADDRRAGQLLFSRHFDAVYRFFRNKFRQGIDDLVQQTFMRLVEGQERLRESQNFRAFLFGIAHNVLREHLRELDRERRFDPLATSIMELDPGPSTIHARRREQQLLLQALRRIPLAHQVALELTYWEGLNAAQIAEIVGVPHPTMRNRLRRARQLLEQAITELDASPELRESTAAGLETWAMQVRDELSPNV